MLEIIFSKKIDSKYDPLDPKTLEIEQKLGSLSIGRDGKVQGITPIKGSEKTGLKNSGFKRVKNLNFLVAPQKNNGIVIIDEV